ncbi:unnamed protein product [Peronospora belbahrii]|uniref:Uncharacterized protein n=1 Tax=Peronospora belbahrii TaxID=622444 RepID=A0ABN8DBF3_9STRA|nr:unnamed protein product [Peronospora belbahrii]
MLAKPRRLTNLNKQYAIFRIGALLFLPAVIDLAAGQLARDALQSTVLLTSKLSTNGQTDVIDWADTRQVTRRDPVPMLLACQVSLTRLSNLEAQLVMREVATTASGKCQAIALVRAAAGQALEEPGDAFA